MSGIIRKTQLLSLWYLGVSAITAFASSKIVPSKTDARFVPGADSFRLSFDLGTPRRYATRFLKEKRLLQIRVSPAKAAEFDATKYYDSKYIHRVLVQEENGEVVISLQLKNESLGWVVVSQSNPWRIVIDIWKTEPSKQASLEEKWSWLDDVSVSDHSNQNEHTSNASPQMPVVIEHALQQEVAHNKVEPVRAPSESGDAGNSSRKFPENFGRLDSAHKQSKERIEELQKKAGMVLGSTVEFKASATLAEELYHVDQVENALNIYRRIAAMSQNEFKENPRIMWLAGESGYLARNFDLSGDYLRAIVLHHPNSEYASLAKLRLLDIELLRNKETNPTAQMSERVSASYNEIALSEKSAWQARIAATLRLLHGNIDKRSDAAKLYQQNLNACVNRGLVPFDMRKNCAYIQTRFAIDKMDVLSADAEIQRFKRLAEDDERSAILEAEVQKNIRSMLEETNRSKSWDTWIEFEKKARPALLEFTLKDASMVFARAEAWEAVGEPKKSAQLFALHWQLSNDEKKKNETAAIAAKLYLKSGDSTRGDLYLRRLEENDSRKLNGLSDRGVAAIREIALPPYRNRRAVRILMDEITSGRYVEPTLSALIHLARMQRNTGAADSLYEKVIAFPPKSPEDAALIETTIMQYADDLRNTNRNVKAGDLYLAVANLNKSGRRAEAAYKAGIAYSRAGMLEKAKSAWQIAASDLNDKRYGTLAAERLEKLR